MSNKAFDSADAPPPALMDKCVHCGFCLPSCPTYLLWGEEMDSPRGRIYLMRAASEGRADLSPSFVGHFDACLGCMACVTACPSGVQYGPLIERTRAQIERRHTRGLADRLFRSALFAVVPFPARLRFVLAPLVVLGGAARAIGRSPALAGWVPARLRAVLALAPPVTLASLTAGPPERTPAAREVRAKVGLLAGCVQRIVFAHVNQSTINVLSAEGCEVVAPAGQGCCGALALHAGKLDDARAFARRLIDAFEHSGVERIVVNAAGCGSSMKEYGELLADDPEWAARARAFAEKVRDVSQVLAELGEPRATRHPIRARVAYHDACHLAHAQGVRSEPREQLRAIPGLDLVSPAESEICCGSAGIYNLVEPEAAAALGERKVGHLAKLDPDLVATGNPGCTLQIASSAAKAGRFWPVVHPVELIDASIRDQGDAFLRRCRASASSGETNARNA
jgi:glycolate oxidase iron-sulfur subunit